MIDSNYCSPYKYYETLTHFPLVTHIQSGTVITRSNIAWYWIHHCSGLSRIKMKIWIQKKHPIPRPNASCGVYFVWILKKIDRVITAPHCMCQWTWSVLIQVMAFRLFGSKPYLNQCWSIVNWILKNKLQWNLNKIQNFSFKKMHLKTPSAKWGPFCPGGDELSRKVSYMTVGHMSLNMIKCIAGMFYPSALQAGGVLSYPFRWVVMCVGNGFRYCGMHISENAGQIFSNRISVELSMHVDVQHHGHLAICPIWACLWAKV